MSLTHDSQLSGDRVSAENFQQHAEHYSRILAEAQKELAEKQIETSNQNATTTSRATFNSPSSADQQNNAVEFVQGSIDKAAKINGDIKISDSEENNCLSNQESSKKSSIQKSQSDISKNIAKNEKDSEKSISSEIE